jgi:3-hydroxyacyl-[acyl-carrier-protein] dehydratase
MPPPDNPLQSALDRLPHGPEFRFLDRLIRLVPGQSGTGDYLVRGCEPFLRGHFPSHPIFPGVLLIEAAAQLAGAIAQSHPTIPPFSHLKLTAVHHAKILGSATPGQTITFEANILARLANLIQAHVTATTNSLIILQTDLTLSGTTAP